MSRPSRLLVVGAAGRTGLLLTRLAADEGHLVTTLSRHPVSGDTANTTHRQIIGDARDPAILRDAFEDQDAVITAIAAPDRRRTTMVTEATRAVLSAMHAAGVTRLVVTSSRNLTATGPWVAVAPTKWVFRHVYADLAQAEELVRSSGLDWTGQSCEPRC